MNLTSASTAGAAETLAMHGAIPRETAGIATVPISVTSALSNLPMISSAGAGPDFNP